MEPKLKIDLITIFPEMVEGFTNSSMLGRAIKKGIISFKAHNLRDWAEPPHRIVDDRPFGGGAGMLVLAKPLVSAIESLRDENSHVIYLSPDGKPLKTELAKELSGKKHIILVSGHYEGIDQRVREHWIDEEISIGDFVLTNGTLPAAVLTDAICRHIPNVLGEEKSLTQDSFNGNLLSFPQYTRPSIFRGHKVPEVLLSGNHQAIQNWRHEQQIKKTEKRRPDLLISKQK